MGALHRSPSRSCCCSSSSSATSSAASPPAPSRADRVGPRPHRTTTAPSATSRRSNPTLGDTVHGVAARARTPIRPTDVWVRTTPDAEPHFTAAVVDRTHAARDVVARRHRRAQPGDQLPLPARRRAPAIASSTAPAPTTAASATPTTSACRPTPRRRRGWPTPPSTRSSPTASPAPGAERRLAGRGPPGGVGRPGSTRRAHAPCASSTAATWPASRPTSTTSPSLGAGGLYLTPFFPAPSIHRYDADTFDHVDPLLGGDDALISLVKACHNRGIRVIGDLTINHAGAGHEWFRAAQADAIVRRGWVLLLPPPSRRLRGVVRRADAAQVRPARRRARAGA